MTVKQEFIDFLNRLMEAAPDVTNQMSPAVKNYIELFMTDDDSKSILTDNGKLILNYMKENQSSSSDIVMFKAKDIALGLDVPSRNVSGSMRKLVTDGFVEKIGKDPVIYILTDKGKDFAIN